MKNGFFEVRVCSAELFEILKKPVDVQRIKHYVEHCADCIRGFLRAFFDAEGSISRLDNNRVDLRVANTYLELLMYIKTLLEKLGVETTGPHIQNSKDLLIDPKTGKVYQRKKVRYFLLVRVRTKNLLTFYNEVGFAIPRKMEGLEEHLRRRGKLPPTPIFSLHANWLRINGPAGI